MNIEISIGTEQILLRADSLNYELCKIRQRKDEVTGEVTDEWAPFRYFASLPQALNRLVDMKVRASDASSLKELAEDLKSTRKEITEVWSTATDAGKCSCSCKR